jgi:hypothetical protein
MKLLHVILLALAVVSIAAMPATKPATHPAPDVVLLQQLVGEYEPVPFDHNTHAGMAEMWNGCETCHHREHVDSKTVQACRTCHDPAIAEPDLHQPGLKGAYHRQCLNCHREWANENSCDVCHKRLNGKLASATTAPSVDDIVGRMHPPIPEPDVKAYRARFTPAVGANAIFRHKEHTTEHKVKCASCHHRDTCADCHDGKARTIANKPLKFGRTWNDSHGPCMSCHKKDRCAHCHYDKTPPPPHSQRAATQIVAVAIPAPPPATTNPSTRAVIMRIRR